MIRYSGGEMKARKDRRTTISLDELVWSWARDLMASKGFNNNLSSYIADLIRRDKEREEEKQAALGKSSSSTSRYPAPQPHLNEARETPAAAAPPPAKKKRAA